jgi:hypothetical protein
VEFSMDGFLFYDNSVEKKNCKSRVKTRRISVFNSKNDKEKP